MVLHGEFFVGFFYIRFTGGFRYSEGIIEIARRHGECVLVTIMRILDRMDFRKDEKYIPKKSENNRIIYRK